MRQLVPQVKCDRCGDFTDIEVPTTIVSLELPGRPKISYAGENCEACAKELAEMLVNALQDYLVVEKAGKRTKKSTKSPGVASTADLGEYGSDGHLPEHRTCPRCGAVPISRGALGQHLGDKHQTTLKAEGMRLTRAESAAAKQRVRDRIHS